MSTRPPRLRFPFFISVLCICAALFPAVSPAAERQIAGILSAESELGTVFLPLKRTEVELEMTAGLVSGRVTQVFENDTSASLEAVYTFPLPSRATVTDLNLTVGDRVIRSVVKEREEAKKTYRKAKKAGKKAALLEEERPNIFTASVANFLPGETVKITFSYLQPIDFERDKYSVTFPMVVGQRYVPYDVVREAGGVETAVPAAADAARINPVVLHPNLDPAQRLSLEVRIAGVPVSKLRSSTHQIRVEETSLNPPEYRVTLADRVTVPDCDFNLDCYLAERADPGLSLVSSRRNGWEYGLFTVFPPTGSETSQTLTIPATSSF